MKANQTKLTIMSTLVLAGCSALPAVNQAGPPAVGAAGDEAAARPTYGLLAAPGGQMKVSSVSASSCKTRYFPAGHTTDGKPSTAWAPAPGDKKPSLTYCLPKPCDLNTLGLKLSHQTQSTAPIRVKVEVDTGKGFCSVGTFTPKLGCETEICFPVQAGVTKVRLCFDTSDLYVCEVRPCCHRPKPSPSPMTRQSVIFSYGGLPADETTGVSPNGLFLPPGDPAGATPATSLHLGALDGGVGEAIFIFGDFGGGNPVPANPAPPLFNDITSVTVRALPTGPGYGPDGAPRWIFYIDMNDNGLYDDQVTDAIIFGTDQFFDQLPVVPGTFQTVDYSTFTYVRNTDPTPLTLAQVKTLYGNHGTLGVSVLVDAPTASVSLDEFTVQIAGKQPLIAGEPTDAPIPRGGQ